MMDGDNNNQTIEYELQEVVLNDDGQKNATDSQLDKYPLTDRLLYLSLYINPSANFQYPLDDILPQPSTAGMQAHARSSCTSSCIIL